MTNEQGDVKQPAPTHLLVAVELVEKIGEYLQSKPYREVALLLSKLMQSQGVTVQSMPTTMSTPPPAVTGEESPS